MYTLKKMYRKQIAWVLVIMAITKGRDATFSTTKTDYETIVNHYSNSGTSLTDLRPLPDQTAAMSVFATMYLYSINGFDAVAGQVEIDCSIKLQWTDQSSLSFSGTGNMGVSASKIWVPELVLLNAVDTVKSVGDSSYVVRYDRSTGKAEWQPKTIIKASCTPDVTYFPFDRQTCSFTYTPWGFSTEEIDLVLQQSPWNQDFYTSNGVWSLISSKSEEYTSANAPFIKFTFIIEREYLYFLFNVLLPVLLLSLLNGFVFLMPAESGSRAGFCVTCFLSFVFLLQMTMSLLPQTSEPMSLFCVYLVCMMAFSLLISILTIAMLRIHHKPEKDVVPSFIQTVVRALKCVNRCRSKDSETKIIATDSSDSETKIEDLGETEEGQSTQSSQKETDTNGKESKKGGKAQSGSDRPSSNTDQERSSSSESSQYVVGWQEVGRILDWFFFILFLGGQTAFTIVFIVPLGTQY